MFDLAARADRSGAEHQDSGASLRAFVARDGAARYLPERISFSSSSR